MSDSRVRRTPTVLAIALLVLAAAGTLALAPGGGDAAAASAQASSGWATTLAGTGAASVAGAVERPEGGVVVAGTTTDDVGGTDAWLAAVENGSVAWNRTYGATGNATAAAVTRTDDGYAFVGEREVDGEVRTWLVETNESGAVLALETYDRRAPTALLRTADGGYVLAGGDDVDVTPWLLKVDADESVAWDRALSDRPADRADAVVAAADGGYAVAGTTRANGTSDADFWLVETDPAGVVEWSRTYDRGFAAQTALTLDRRAGGGYVLGGFAEYDGAWVLATDESGDAVWEDVYRDETMADTRAVAAGDRGVAVAVQPFDPGEGVTLVRTDAEGEVTWRHRLDGARSLSAAASVVRLDRGRYVVAGTDGDEARVVSVDRTTETADGGTAAAPSPAVTADAVASLARGSHRSPRTADGRLRTPS